MPSVKVTVNRVEQGWYWFVDGMKLSGYINLSENADDAAVVQAVKDSLYNEFERPVEVDVTIDRK